MTLNDQIMKLQTYKMFEGEDTVYVERDCVLKLLEQEPCDDAISRQSAIFLASDLKQDLPDDERISDMVMAHNEGILEYQTQLSLLPPVTPQPKTGRWIPVSERLPKEYGEYICTMSNGNVQECGFVPSGEKGLISGWSTCEADGFKKLNYQDVIAWMPLPKPYKAESEVQDADR